MASATSSLAPYPLEEQLGHYGILIARMTKDEVSHFELEQYRSHVLASAYLIYGVECANVKSHMNDRAEIENAAPYPQVFSAYLLQYARQPELALDVLKSVDRRNRQNVPFLLAILRTWEMHEGTVNFEEWFGSYFEMVSLLEHDLLYAYRECRDCCEDKVNESNDWLADQITAIEITLALAGNNVLYHFTVRELAKQTSIGRDLSNTAQYIADGLFSRMDFLEDATSSEVLIGKTSDARDLHTCLIRRSNRFPGVKRMVTRLMPLSRHTIGIFSVSNAYARGILTREGLRYINETWIGVAEKEIRLVNQEAKRNGALSSTAIRQENEISTHYKKLHDIYREP